jgi:lipoprotein-anchoring transpeptidase ErfK/SrfK
MLRKYTKVLIINIMVAGASLNPLLANDRYKDPPYLQISPDISNQWTQQLNENAPKIAISGIIVRGAVSVRRNTTAPEHKKYRENKKKTTIYSKRSGTNRTTHSKKSSKLNPIYLPQEVPYKGLEQPGTIIVDTKNKFLFLVGENGVAQRYGVGVSKPGFEWKGTHTISRMAQWPQWFPPQEMKQRVRLTEGRILPDQMEGGEKNPLGARALYLGNSLYRIHGTNQPWTIGKNLSSGCIRMRNEDVTDLYDRVSIGTKVIVR